MSDKELKNNNTLEKYSYELNAKYDDKNFKELNNKFIRHIDEEYDKFLETLKIAEIENKKFSDTFISEKSSRKSPITIIDAPWGSGKTYFIENFTKSFLEEKIKSRFFKKIIIIDTWKFSNSRDIPNEIMSEIFYKLIKGSKTEKAEAFKKLASRIFNTTLRSWINNGLHIELSEIDTKVNKEKVIEDISKKIDPTIIFLDNIERIGRNSWEVIKAIMKLCQVKSFFIILPMNIKQLKKFDINLEGEENYIQKVIDIPYFKFRQEYNGMISKNIKNADEVKIFNDILKTDINGFNLSIRQAEVFLRNINFKNNETIFEKIKVFFNDVWGPSEKATKIIINIMKEMDFFDLICKQEALFQILKKVLNSVNKPNIIGNSLDKNILGEFNFIENYFFSHKLYFLNHLYEKNINENKEILYVLKEEYQKLHDGNLKVINNLESNILDLLAKKDERSKKVLGFEKELNKEIDKEKETDGKSDDSKLEDLNVKRIFYSDLIKKGNITINEKKAELKKGKKTQTSVIKEFDAVKTLIVSYNENSIKFLKNEKELHFNKDLKFLLEKMSKFESENNISLVEIFNQKKLGEWSKIISNKILGI